MDNRRLIDADWLLECLKKEAEFCIKEKFNEKNSRFYLGRETVLTDIINQIESGKFDISPIPPTIKPGDKVRHEELGDGIVFALDKEDQEITIVDFDNEGLMHIYCADLEVSHD
ncbi:hypothetical protein [Paenibacillus humicus]|uniref:hypothetical protein n=1 Tax=Paenibacillus humicus TaxID=412861 RepID=UPI003D29415A